ncbi:hypothetical protein NA56DRAFT_702281 [Hyaloscypha hepaticicola]|uniref:Uncharacterized protein n=1 Tax=Hyaloscypha hepaticicola TaxID=2082293 RepID=A0A2J6Q881_9HELO|nr:hypothetical protein NA56DRAFT_702281 [Hyaloscypha hepaticicola]
MPGSKLVGSKAFHVGNATESPAASTGADEPAAGMLFPNHSPLKPAPATGEPERTPS